MAKSTVNGLIGRKQTYHAVYDFSVDGGTNASPIDLFSLKANTIIHDFWYEVETAVTSAGSATIEAGVTGSDTDGYITQVAKTVPVINHISSPDEKGAVLYDSTDDHNLRRKATAAEVVSLLIGTADLTAGKIHFYIEASQGY